KKAYAQKPEEVPKSWEVFQVSGQEGLYQLMFALQTSYALTARLILAKVVEDYAKSYEKGLRPPLLSELLGHELKDPGHRSNIPPWAYPQAVRKVFKKAYAQKPEEVPKSWEVFQVSGQEGLYQLMFAL
ncbi:hypothetical protein, partial [Streptococcus pneumoniae]|uniref:hypothetical protein n=1 Tax=Streptococcus pneumoniae TaxID=1313 RepID=UPI0016623DC2